MIVDRGLLADMHHGERHAQGTNMLSSMHMEHAPGHLVQTHHSALLETALTLGNRILSMGITVRL